MTFHVCHIFHVVSLCFPGIGGLTWFDQVYNIQEKMMVQLQPLEAMERLEASRQPLIRLVDEAYWYHCAISINITVLCHHYYDDVIVVHCRDGWDMDFAFQAPVKETRAWKKHATANP